MLANWREMVITYFSAMRHPPSGALGGARRAGCLARLAVLHGAHNAGQRKVDDKVNHESNAEQHDTSLVSWVPTPLYMLEVARMRRTRLISSMTAQLAR